MKTLSLRTYILPPPPPLKTILACTRVSRSGSRGVFAKPYLFAFRPGDCGPVNCTSLSHALVTVSSLLVFFLAFPPRWKMEDRLDCESLSSAGIQVESEHNPPQQQTFENGGAMWEPEETRRDETNE